MVFAPCKLDPLIVPISLVTAGLRPSVDVITVRYPAFGRGPFRSSVDDPRQIGSGCSSP